MNNKLPKVERPTEQDVEKEQPDSVTVKPGVDEHQIGLQLNVHDKIDEEPEQTSTS